MLNTASEATSQVLAARRLDVVQRLAGVGSRRHTDVDTACASLLEVLAAARTDIPAAALYVLHDPTDPTSALVLRGAQGTGAAHLPRELAADDPAGAWLHAGLQVPVGDPPILATELDVHWPGLEPAPDHVGGGPVTSAWLLPLSTSSRTAPVGVMVLGLSPHLRVDQEYETFLRLLAAQLATVIGDTLDSLAEQAEHAAAHSFAEALQRSLLTDPVQPENLEIVARYRPAVTAAHVGGDWYDAFLCQDGSTWLVVGDVAGHDQQAAATMAQVRNMVRTLACTMEDSPAAVLTAVDRAMTGLQVQALTTDLAARIDQEPADLGTGIRRLRWTNAGHPPPLHATTNTTGVRTAQALHTHPELPLGVAPGARRTDNHLELGPGDDVVLFTDGLIERRRHDLDDGIDWLATTLAEPTTADEGIRVWSDTVLHAIRHHADDDVALLAFRAHPQNQPRPPSAGPFVAPLRLPTT